MAQVKFHMNSLKLHKSRCDSVIIQTQWTASNVTINLVLPSADAVSLGYSSELSMSKLKDIAAGLERPWEEFLGEVKRALCTETGLDNFQYECDENEMKFIWRKVGGYKIPVKLTSNNALCFELLRNSMQVVSALNVSLQNAENELDAWKNRHQTLKSAFEECVEEKKQNENNYLARFILLLNAKKEKIRELKGQTGQQGCTKAVPGDFNFGMNSDDVDEDQAMSQPRPSTSAVEDIPVVKSLRKRNADISSVSSLRSAPKSSNVSPAPPMASNTASSPMRAETTADVFKFREPSKATSPPKTSPPREEMARSTRSHEELLRGAQLLLAETQNDIYDCDTQFFNKI